MKRRTVAVLVVTGLALGLATVPFASLHCPAWTVTVVDNEDHPIPGMTVRLSYQNYSAENGSHEMDKITDQRGQVTFSEQRLHASVLRRCYYTLRSASAGVHATFGPYASVFAFSKGLEGSDVDPKKGTLVFWKGTPSRMQSRIVVSPRTN